MNADEVKSLLTKVLLMLFTGLSTSLHLDESASSLAAGSTDVADLIVLGYGIYSHWNMKKVAETARVVAPVGALGFIAAAFLLGFMSPSSAADLRPALKAAPAVFDPAGSGGWYVGLGSQLETAKATIGSTDVLSQSGSIGAIGGYGRGNGVTWWQVQGEAYYKNLSGSGFCGLNTACGTSSNFSGAAVFKFGGPITSVLLQALPQVSSLFPGLAPTTIANNVFPYVGGVINFEDMSGTFGDANARDWRFPIGLRLGAITKLTNGTVSDAGAEVDFAGSGFAVGKATVNPGVAYKAYLHFAFGA